MRLLGVGLSAEILFIAFGKHVVFKRVLELHVFVALVGGFHAPGALDAVVLNGLSAAADASAGACHDFDEVIRGFAVGRVLRELSGRAEGVDDRDLELGVAGFDGGFFEALASADFFEFETVHGDVSGDFSDRVA